MTNYSTPKLCDRGGDLSKQWYVYLYYTNSSGVRKQFRFSEGVNVLKTKRERRTEANALIEALTYQLRSGWSPVTNTVENRDGPHLKTVSAAFDEIFEIKKAYLTGESIRTYKNQIDLFKGWIVAKSLTTSTRRTSRLITRESTATGCCGKKILRKDVQRTSHYAPDILHGDGQQEIHADKPRCRIQVCTAGDRKNITYSAEDEKLFKSIRDVHPEFYLATRFVKYCFLRRTELAKLQVKHINWGQ